MVTAEKCGAWVEVGGYKGCCMLPIDHEGRCLPFRSEVMDAAEWHERRAGDIYSAIAREDKLGSWPHEGPAQ